MMRMLVFVLMVGSGVCWAFAEEGWPDFRGPLGNGHAANSQLPERWSETENIVWKTEIPGRGCSTPVVEGNVAWITSSTVQQLSNEEWEKRKAKKLANMPIASQMEVVGPARMFLVGVDLSNGKKLREIDLFQVDDPDPVHKFNSYATPSPVIREGRIYCHFGKFGTACVDTKSGEVLWKREFPINHIVGPGSSPILLDDLLIIPCDGADKQYLVAVHAENGKDAWRVDRPPVTGKDGDMHKAFSTPLVIEHAGRKQLVTICAQWVVSYDPKSGEELWRVRHGEGFSNVPRPITGDGVVYVCTGFNVPELWAIRVDGQGDVTETHVLWKYKRQVPTMSSPILVDGAIYFVSDQGVLNCVDAAKGELNWQKRIKGNYSASMLYADGKIYVSNREGETVVFRPGKEFQEVAVNGLAGPIFASPVPIGSTLLLRTDTHLYRIGKR